MTITVEDGSHVPNANSYASVANLTAHATDRGIALPADPEKEILLIKAMDYMEVLNYSGIADWPETAFPRDGATTIPPAIVKAQCVLAIAAMSIELLPAVSGSANPKKQIQVGPIQVTYQDSLSRETVMPFITQAAALLRPFIASYGQLNVVRA